MVSRTREKLIEVARQLFAYKGVENTTMSDIANASDKGRRTIYTYFKSKREIYEATIESDSDRMVQQLKDLISDEPSAIGKLRRVLQYRLDMFESSTQKPRSVSFNSFLLLNFNRIDKVRVLALNKEKEILNQILEQGVEDHSFDPEQAKRVIPVLQFIMKGVDLAMVQGMPQSEIELSGEEYKEVIINYIIKSLIPKS